MPQVPGAHGGPSQPPASQPNPKPSSSAAAANGQPFAPSAHNGWGDLRFAVNRNIPGSLRTANRSLSAALQVLAQSRRVRGR